MSTVKKVEKKMHQGHPFNLKHTFDVSRTLEILDFLFSQGCIKFSEDHPKPPSRVPKGKAWCRFHGRDSHSTSVCGHFRQAVQRAINDGRLKFAGTEMAIETDPFPKPEVNMLRINEGGRRSGGSQQPPGRGGNQQQSGKGKTKAL